MVSSRRPIPDIAAAVAAVEVAPVVETAAAAADIEREMVADASNSGVAAVVAEAGEEGPSPNSSSNNDVAVSSH